MLYSSSYQKSLKQSTLYHCQNIYKATGTQNIEAIFLGYVVEWKLARHLDMMDIAIVGILMFHDIFQFDRTYRVVGSPHCIKFLRRLLKINVSLATFKIFDPCDPSLVGQDANTKYIDMPSSSHPILIPLKVISFHSIHVFHIEVMPLENNQILIIYSKKVEVIFWKIPWCQIFLWWPLWVPPWFLAINHAIRTVPSSPKQPIVPQSICK